MILKEEYKNTKEEKQEQQKQKHMTSFDIILLKQKKML
jgi:hypothetical protein